MLQENKLPKVISKELFINLAEILSENYGLNFFDDRFNDLENLTINYFKKLRVNEPEKYIQALINQENEIININSFVNFLTIGETYFFRGDETFDLLGKVIYPVIFQNSAIENREINILSAACSTGEEVYSTLIHLEMLGYLNLLNKINIYGVDVNSDFLERARAGVYREWSFRNRKDEIIQNYFIKSNDTFEILPKFKSKPEFYRVNLVDRDEILSHFSINSFDLILVRNFFIYLTQKNINRIVRSLTELLRPGGYLLTSPSEVALIENQTLNKIFNPGLNYFTKQNEKIQTYQIRTNNLQKSNSKDVPVFNLEVDEKKRCYDGLQLLLKLNQWNQYAEIVEELLCKREFRKTLGINYGEKIAEVYLKHLIEHGENSRAIEFSSALKSDFPVSLEVNYLIALAYKEEGDLTNAIMHFENLMNFYPFESKVLAAMLNLYYKIGDVQGIKNIKFKLQNLLDKTELEIKSGNEENKKSYEELKLILGNSI